MSERTETEKTREAYLRAVRTAAEWRDQIVRATDVACKQMFENAWQVYSSALLAGERVEDPEAETLWVTPDDDEDPDDEDGD